MVEVINKPSISDFLDDIESTIDYDEKKLKIKALADYMMGDDYQKQSLKERIKGYMQVLSIIGPNYKTVLNDSATQVVKDKKGVLSDQVGELTMQQDNLTRDLKDLQKNLAEAKNEAQKHIKENNEAIKRIDEQIEEAKKKVYTTFGIRDKKEFYFKDGIHSGYNGIVGLVESYEPDSSQEIIKKLVDLDVKQVKEDLLIKTDKDGVMIADQLSNFFNEMDTLFHEKEKLQGGEDSSVNELKEKIGEIKQEIQKNATKKEETQQALNNVNQEAKNINSLSMTLAKYMNMQTEDRLLKALSIEHKDNKYENYVQYKKEVNTIQQKIKEIDDEIADKQKIANRKDVNQIIKGAAEDKIKQLEVEKAELKQQLSDMNELGQEVDLGEVNENVLNTQQQLFDKELEALSSNDLLGSIYQLMHPDNKSSITKSGYHLLRQHRPQDVQKSIQKKLLVQYPYLQSIVDQGFTLEVIQDSSSFFKIQCKKDSYNIIVDDENCVCNDTINNCTIITHTDGDDNTIYVVDDEGVIRTKEITGNFGNGLKVRKEDHFDDGYVLYGNTNSSILLFEDGIPFLLEKTINDNKESVFDKVEIGQQGTLMIEKCNSNILLRKDKDGKYQPIQTMEVQGKKIVFYTSQENFGGINIGDKANDMEWIEIEEGKDKKYYFLDKDGAMFDFASGKKDEENDRYIFDRYETFTSKVFDQCEKRYYNNNMIPLALKTNYLSPVKNISIDGSQSFVSSKQNGLSNSDKYKLLNIDTGEQVGPLFDKKVISFLGNVDDKQYVLLDDGLIMSFGNESQELQKVDFTLPKKSIFTQEKINNALKNNAQSLSSDLVETFDIKDDVKNQRIATTIESKMVKKKFWFSNETVEKKIKYDMIINITTGEIQYKKKS